MTGRIRQALLALALGLPLALAACGGEVLYDDLTQREANQIVTALRQSGIGAERVSMGEGVFAVSVDPANFSESVRLLEQRGLPRRRFQTVGEVFAADGLMSTPLEERVRFAFALSEELAHSLTAIDGVLDAHVHLTLPEDRPLSDEPPMAKASVLLTHAPDFDMEAVVPDVKLMVAKGVPDLGYRNVSVVALPEHQWEQPRRPARHYAEFLGIRFIEGDARKFWMLLLSCLTAILMVLGLLLFVLWQFGLLAGIRRDLAGINLRALADPLQLRALITGGGGRRGTSNAAPAEASDAGEAAR